ncbi:MAG: glycosyltransferase, partial [Tabrizicola sp.]|nr:glycosyltransferase [Tabrizicola sp.]
GERFDVVVSAGGGAVGAALIAGCLGAAGALPEVRRWCIVTGPNLPPEKLGQFQAAARPGVEIFRFRRDFAALLGSAELSISQAGYNTVCDILGAGCRALLVPFASGGETEQTRRANRLAELGLASVLTEQELSSATMTKAIRQALSGPKPPPATLQLDGASRSAAILVDLENRRRNPN